MKTLMLLLYFIAYVHTSLTASRLLKSTVCSGTNNQMTKPLSQEDRYNYLKHHYTNCTFVKGNLEITWIQNKTYHLNFLEQIREVSGYVLISHVDVDCLKLPNLQLIRGESLFRSGSDCYGLYVASSGVRSLEMPSLSKIVAGSLGVFNNSNLRFLPSIERREIISGTHVNGEVEQCLSPTLVCSDHDEYLDMESQKCEKCHEECNRCKGPGQNNCLSCRKFKIFDDNTKSDINSFAATFTCSSDCPPDKRYKVFPDSDFDPPYCSDELPKHNTNSTLILFWVLVLFVIVLAFVCLILLIVIYRNKLTAQKLSIKLNLGRNRRRPRPESNNYVVVSRI